MTPEELAEKFVKFATEKVRETPFQAGRSSSYMTAAFLIRKHLCTPLQAAAPDMLELLQDIDRSTYLPRETGLQERLEAVVAKAKGTPDVTT